ncbi:MAG TPA: hypothetical protein VLR26_17105 [Frankiaceae bacterium]|nr:hypothetical protein [Frankiaceae bacterium]
MSRCSSFVVVLSESDRALLQARAGAYTAPYSQVVRARIVLLAAEGLANARQAVAEGLVTAVSASSVRRRIDAHRPAEPSRLAA